MRNVEEDLGHAGATPLYRAVQPLCLDALIVADIAVVNPALTGSALTMHVLVRMQQAGPQTMDNFAREIVRYPEITGAWDVTGEDDFLLKIQVGTMEDYDRFTRRALSEDKGVHSFTTMIAIRNIMNVVLTYDHRLVDGLMAGRFLQSFKKKLEAFEFFR